ncbi:MAG: hypothetical protein HKP61_15155 [Dactylosporangium sp.]|nr:hypothetical protein [Dactylosporangium sp.]NNJ62248.1 hypothetical protein [Dactylosporangium sp.]
MASDDITTHTRRRTRILVAKLTGVATVIAVVVVCPIFAASRLVAPAPTAPAGRPVGTAFATARVPGSGAGGDLVWTEVAGVPVPVSRTVGPRDTSAGRARGFSHDGMGAVFAAIHISLRLSPQVGPVVFEATLRQQVVGDGAPALGQQLASDYDQTRQRLGLPYGQPAGRLHARVRGWCLDAETPAQVVIRLLVEGSTQDGESVLAATVMRLRWASGDWALVAPPDGDWSRVMTAVATVDGYTPAPDPGGA